MVGRPFLIVLFFFIVSCAQVGNITGGDKDVFAPRIVEEKSTQNGQTSFNEKVITIEFDEYFKLNNPVKNIRLVPDDAKISASVNKKTLSLQLEGELQPNTTYAIYFNKAIKDITEGNDSIFQFVFSTGVQIDSLSYSGKIIDAKTNKPLKDLTVILKSESNPDVRRFASSNSTGEFLFSYLPRGNYSVVAIDDKNLNTEHDEHERIGFQNTEFFKLPNSIQDSIPIRVFTPKEKVKFNSRFLGDYVIGVGSNYALNENTSFFVNNQIIERESILNLSPDSILVYLEDSSSIVDLIIKQLDISDTIRLRNSFKKQSSFKLNKIPSYSYLPQDSIKYFTTDKLIDAGKFYLLSKEDTLEITPYLNNNLLYIPCVNILAGDYNLVVDQNQIRTKHGGNLKYQESITIQDTSRLCSIDVSFKGFSGSIGVRLIKDKNILEELWVDAKIDVISFNKLTSGEYTFEIIEDLNSNSCWDTGDFNLRLQPEPIHHYSKPTKLRSGWSSSIELHNNLNE